MGVVRNVSIVAPILLNIVDALAPKDYSMRDCEETLLLRSGIS